NDTFKSLPIEWVPWWGNGTYSGPYWDRGTDTSVHTLLLPFIEQNPLFQFIHKYGPWMEGIPNPFPAGPTPANPTVLSVYQAPSDGVSGTLDYPAGYGDGAGAWYSWMRVHTFAMTNYVANTQVFGNPRNTGASVNDGWNLNNSTRSLAVQKIRDGSS